MTPGERLKLFRLSQKERGDKITQESIAKKIGVTKGTISRIENGSMELGERTAKDICREYNVNLDWLLTGEGDMFSDNKIDPLELLREEKKLSDFSTALIKAYVSLDKSIRESLDKNIQELINAFRSSGGGYK